MISAYPKFAKRRQRWQRRMVSTGFAIITIGSTEGDYLNDRSMKY